MHALRTRFKKDIVAEFLLPVRKADWRKGRVIIICPGMPGMPPRRRILEFWAQKGYWVFSFRYRGSWESSGSFLRFSPEKDVLDIIDTLPKGFTDSFGGRRLRVKPSSIYLFGISFGGSAALLASRDVRVKKVVCFSPVVDWKDHVKHGETIDWTHRFTRDAFGEAYRFSNRDWKKQKEGRFYNPMAYAEEIDGSKIMIIHAKDDTIVRYQPVQKFARLTRARLWLLSHGGHTPSVWYTQPRFYKRIKKFLAV